MIVVTGMHRSGTSLLCQLLERLGFPFGLGDDPFATDRWNECGYFESEAVMDLNSRIVTGFPRNRSRIAAGASKLRYAMLPGHRGQERRAGKLANQLSELAELHRDHVVKDPRFCLTLRYWRGVVDIGHVVVCLRRPDAIVASMQRRDRLPPRRGFRFYDYHVAALLEQLPVERSALVDMDAIAEGRSEAELDTLRAFLGLDDGSALETVVREVVQPELYRSAPIEPLPLPAKTRALWERLVALAAQRRRAIMAVAERT